MNLNIILSAEVNWAEGLSAIVGIIATIFLVWTFSEQRKITKIEQTNFRLQHLPTFEFGGGGTDEGSRRKISIECTILKNSIKKLKIRKFEVCTILIDTLEYEEKLILNVNDKIHITASFSFDSLAKVGWDNLRGGFTLNFVDNFNNLYKQDIYILASKIAPQQPVFIRQLDSIGEI